MTDPYARPAESDGDATIPLVPEEGYSATAEIPFTEDTVVNPTGTPAASPWAADPPFDVSAPVYGNPSAGYPAPAPTATNYTQPQVGYPQPDAAPAGYQPWPEPAPSGYAQSTYAQPHASGQTAASGAYQQRQTQGPYAEPAGLPGGVPAQNIYQGYPTAQPAPAWPTVINDPVSYDYGYSQQPAASEHPNATISLILGIIGLAFFQVLAPVAWFLAAKGRREMAAQPGRWRPSGSLTAGLVLGILGTVLLAVFVMGVLMFFALILAS